MHGYFLHYGKSASQSDMLYFLLKINICGLNTGIDLAVKKTFTGRKVIHLIIMNKRSQNIRLHFISKCMYC